ncbi:MAG: Asp-tRNA(Asn)/Glu-tRNA(Gln) amidotransferase GatCAB subunit B, partial [Bacilli bacterium]
MEKYIVVIGLEMHCEIKSNSKVFSSAKNSYSEMPNKNIMPLDMAFPGTLPVVNKKSVEDAIKMALILNCKIPEYLYFDRK